MTIYSLQLPASFYDNGVTRDNIWELAIWLYRLPGNLIMEGVGNLPLVPELLNIHASASTGYSSLNGTITHALSLLFWVALLLGIISYSSREGKREATESMPEPVQQQPQQQQQPPHNWVNPPI